MGFSQSPDDGKVTGNSYVNSYFKFSYTWSTMLKPYGTSSLRLPQKSAYANEYLLFSARQGDEPFGVVVLAERMGPTPHNRGFRDGADFLDRVVSSFKPEEHARFQPIKHFRSSQGLIFDQVDYTDNSGIESAMVTQFDGFLIVFKSNAKSVADLAEMTKSISELRLAR
jgi:hypothetical protein